MDTTAVATESWVSTSAAIVALLSIIGTVLVALLSSFLTYRFTRKIRLDAEWRIDKLDQYRQVLSALSGMMNARSKDDYDRSLVDYALAANTLALVAPQTMINTMTELGAAMGELGVDKSAEAEDRAKEVIRQLVLQMRKDLEIRPKDNPATFRYVLLATRTEASEQ